jgi:hypothetical protein
MPAAAAQSPIIPRPKLPTAQKLNTVMLGVAERSFSAARTKKKAPRKIRMLPIMVLLLAIVTPCALLPQPHADCGCPIVDPGARARKPRLDQETTKSRRYESAKPKPCNHEISTDSHEKYSLDSRFRGNDGFRDFAFSGGSAMSEVE